MSSDSDDARGMRPGLCGDGFGARWLGRRCGTGEAEEGVE